MRIAHCVEFYEPSKGGVQHHTKLLSEYLSPTHEITILTSYLKNREKKKFNNIKIKDFKIKGNMIRGYVGELDEYQNHLLSENYDIVMFYAAQQWTFDLALPIINKLNSKIIFLPCGFSSYNNLIYKPYYNILVSSKLKYIDKFVCFSRNTRDYKFLIKRISKSKIHVIYNGGNYFGKQKKYNKLKNNILYVANFNYFKNQLYLIFATLFIKHKAKINFIYSKKNLYFLICRFISSFISFINKKISFQFHENLNRKSINKFYLKSEIFVSPSKIECAPLMIADCVTSGLYFISSDVGNVKEIISKFKIGTTYSSFFDLVTKINENLKKNIIVKQNKDLDWKNILPKYKKIYKFN